MLYIHTLIISQKHNNVYLLHEICVWKSTRVKMCEIPLLIQCDFITICHEDLVKIIIDTQTLICVCIFEEFCLQMTRFRFQEIGTYFTLLTS